MLERLRIIEENILQLEQLKVHSLEEIKRQKMLQWALRYGLLETIQAVIDVACHLVSKYNLGNPETYQECIEFLREHKYISEESSKKLSQMIGLRNLLVHEYIKVDISRIYNLLDYLDDFRVFIEEIKDHI
ncbi:MAG: DUF86 domain-containing protein [Nitrospirae bacterium]|nr:DUF86 domain-containing protein [Nitrospirota bacterium]